jgi:LPXTG-motif cell wall-anchored protein
MSNVNGNPVTAPGTNNPGYYFRQGQAVQFVPLPTTNAVGAATWTVTPSSGYITEGSIAFSITDNDLLGNYFALAWAMTCANDVIQGQIDLPSTNMSATPLPAALPLFASGIGLMGFFGLRKKKQRKSAMAAASAA